MQRTNSVSSLSDLSEGTGSHFTPRVRYRSDGSSYIDITAEGVAKNKATEKYRLPHAAGDAVSVSSDNLTERHLKIWEKFFTNAFKANEVRQ